MLGPTAIPLLLGMIPAFKHCDSKAAILSTLAGFSVFVLNKVHVLPAMEVDTALILPTAVAFILFVAVGLINHYGLKKQVPEDVDSLLVRLSTDNEENG